jgi:pimeloyl-ACP methyl ester carboxylesterase
MFSGLARDTPRSDPAVVLIHGASGNLEDMRLALGERLAASHRVIMIDRPGHGWSSRPEGDNYASPARQAEIVASALEKLGVRQAILIGHSWGGACAMAYALAFPERTAGLVLLSAPTHPWPANPGWYNKLASDPYIGPLFLRTCVYPLGLLIANSTLHSVFEPQPVPSGYIHRAAIREGIISERLTAPYKSGPSRNWIKVKNPEKPTIAPLDETASAEMPRVVLSGSSNGLQFQCTVGVIALAPRWR